MTAASTAWQTKTRSRDLGAERLIDTDRVHVERGDLHGLQHATGARSRLRQPGASTTRSSAIGSTIGTTVEWHDAILYGLLVPFYLGRLFFPSTDPLASTLAGYIGLGVSFGAAFFGRFGDCVGRKATLLVGGVASALIGLLPTYVVPAMTSAWSKL